MSPVAARPVWHPVYSTFQPAIFFGLYFASLVHCVRWLLFEDEGWRIRKKINWWPVTTTLLVFFLSTALSFAVTITTFSGVFFRSFELKYNLWTKGPPYSLALTILSSSAIQWSILMVIDSAMIYRCWVVFSKNQSIIYFPVALWCFAFVCEIHSFYCSTEASTIDGPFVTRVCFSKHFSWTPLAFYVCNILINIYTTSALVYKIRHATKNNTSTNRLYRISRILTESGILYTLSSLIYLISWIIFYCTGGTEKLLYINPAGLCFKAPFGSQIALGESMLIPGIAFNLVIIRTGEQRGKGEDTCVDSSKDLPLPTELLNHPDTSTQGEMGEDNHEIMDQGEVVEINETEDGEIMEIDRSRELEGQS